LTAFSYRASFKTTAGEWIEVLIPLDKFVATSFGRIVSNAAPMNPGEITSVGFLLSDKKAGPFKLEVEWIKASKIEASK
jgi:monofunctional biosynthetic peptidoglycan transglycosylase